VTPTLDLAFRLEDGQGNPIDASLLPLVAAAGPLADAGASQWWHGVLGQWLAELRPLLPPALVSPAYSLGLQFTDDACITALNGQWRHRWEPTDVLSFAAQDPDLDQSPPPSPPVSPNPAAGIEVPALEPLELGDIVISLETAARQASEGQQELEAELLFLTSHGLLHLLGWDHPDEASLTAMLTLQRQLIAAI
jgi:probable rRNA maturation factor